METGNSIGLDIGTKRTGVAVSHGLLNIASPHSVIEATQKDVWFKKVTEIIEEEEVTRIVVGMPLNHHGEKGNDANRIMEFIAMMRKRISIPVIEWDERFTTVQAERVLLEADMSRKKRKQVVDKIAAAIILQSYLDSLEFESLPI